MSMNNKGRLPLAVMGLASLMAGCGGESSAPTDTQTALSCDNSMVEKFKPDANTSVVLVKEYKSGEALALSATPSSPAPAVAAADVCLVKLLVGPGNPGVAGAPSTSSGIGIEVWLPKPTAWNKVIRAMGSGGWAGGDHTDKTKIGSRPQFYPSFAKGYVVVTSDHGHVLNNDGSFAMNPDGSINTVLWQDFSERSMHEMAVKSKALAKAYYGVEQQYAYWDGFSTGGRQGFKVAQKYPTDFNGILAGGPAFNWTKFISGELYPQVAMQRELGGPLAVKKMVNVGAATVKSCDTEGVGFLMDPLQCRYDPTKDASVLCAGETGNGVVGTSTNTATCVSNKEARVINQIWYGQTATGAYPDPASDNAGSPVLGSSDHLWWGLTRGTNLAQSLASWNAAETEAKPFQVASDQAALSLQDPTYAYTNFKNATGNGANKWKTLDYAGLANVYAQGIALQPFFSDINTDNADLKAFRDAGGKLLSYHGLADDKIMPQGTINYFTRVSAGMGGNSAIQSFFRLFLIPGHGHDSTFKASGSVDYNVDISKITQASIASANMSKNKVPMPKYLEDADEMFVALRNWVEKGSAPSKIEITSADNSVSMPLCSYPKKATYLGSGSVVATASYSCK